MRRVIADAYARSPATRCRSVQAGQRWIRRVDSNADRVAEDARSLRGSPIDPSCHGILDLEILSGDTDARRKRAAEDSYDEWPAVRANPDPGVGMRDESQDCCGDAEIANPKAAGGRRCNCEKPEYSGGSENSDRKSTRL